MNNLLAGLNSLAAGAAGAASAVTAGEASPQDIPKEELMTLCMKMNKRMQAMESKGKELVKKKATLTAERQKMLDLFRMVMPVPSIIKEDADLDLTALEQSWAEFESRRRDQLADLEARVTGKDQLMQQSLKSMEEHYKKVIADLHATGTNGSSAQEGDATGAPDPSNNAASIESIIEAERDKMASRVCIAAQSDGAFFIRRIIAILTTLLVAASDDFVVC
jgi:hypothetical protein